MEENRFKVAPEQQRLIHLKMREILLQLDQMEGSPLDPEWVSIKLQEIITRRCRYGDVLPPDHYLDRITYARLPSKEALRKKWGKQNVWHNFRGLTFELHTICKKMDRAPGVRIFCLHKPDRGWGIEEMIEWGSKQRNTVAPKGYRPAVHEETYEFANAHTELADFVGLGTSTKCGDRDFFLCVKLYHERRILYLNSHSQWDFPKKILFVAI